MKNNVPVSVIIPCYRCKNTIARALESVLKQTTLPSEVILIDDCSNDGTLEYLEVLKSKHKDLVVKVEGLQTNGGPSVARNTGWELANMPYLAFLDADDTWHPNKLEIQYKWMKEHPDVDICGHQRLVSRVKDECLHLRSDVNYGSDEFNFAVTYVSKFRVLLRNPFSTITVMLKREINKRFDADKYHSEDNLLWQTCVLSGLKVVRLETDLAYIHKMPYGEGGLSQDLIAMQKGNMENYGKLNSLGLLTKPEVYIFEAFSLVKFLRRWLLFMVYKLVSK